MTIPPLLAERIPRSCENSSVIPLGELSEAGQKAAAQLQSNPRSRCMIFDSFEPGNPKLRLTRLKSGEIQAEILRPESPAELRRRLEQEGFTCRTAISGSISAAGRTEPCSPGATPSA